LLLLTVTAAACTTRPTADEPTPSHGRAAIAPHADTGTPAAGSTGEAAVDHAYRQFWIVAQTLDRHPEAQWRPLLSQVAGEPVLTRILDGLHSRVDDGYHQYGTVSPAPTIEVDGAHATVLDCQDASRSGELDSDSGLATNVGRPRTPVTAALTLGPDHHWRVTDARYLPGDC
jgi:hypothetical protein